MSKRNGLPHLCTEFQDRHGKWHVRFRQAGRTHYFKARPGTDEFRDEYRRLLSGEGRVEIGAGRTKPGTINALVVRYYGSVAFTNLAPITRSTYRNVIERFRAEHGDKPVASLERKHVRAIVDARAATPGAANKMLRTIKMLMRFAVEEGWRSDDPTFRVKKVRLASADGFHSWTEKEVATFETRHAIGTKARLAFDLLLYTGQRRSDVVRMGPPDVEDGMIRVTQQKTKEPLWIPMHPKLVASLAAMAAVGLRAFVVTEYGKPRTGAGFGNWFRERCDEAGLPQCSAHGLRKAAATRLADAGSTAHEIMAITGHRNMAEVDTYTRAADQKRNAKAAMAKLIKAGK